MADNPDVLEIVRHYLKRHGYDGLWSGDECACKLDDLAPCGEIRGECTAGYEVPGCDDECGMGCDFHIALKKPNQRGDG